MHLSDFDYELPPEAVAQTPAAERDRSKLMVLERGREIPPTHSEFRRLPGLLAEGDLLVINDTRVINARLKARRKTGGKVEVLLVEPRPGVSGDGGQAVWAALTRSSRPLKPGTELVLPDERPARVLAREAGGTSVLELPVPANGEELHEYLGSQGGVPLPPYIDPRLSQQSHDERYQTVYASERGAVAAPTAGLHFTEELLRRIEEAGVSIARVTLHVGLGTFLPVREEDPSRHRMHGERYRVPEATAQAWARTRREGGRVVAVGTTVARTLEASASASGCGEVQAGEGRTDLFILPGYRFLALDGMITNFHLPRSTLLMMIAAFHGRERILAAYREAVSRGYRFYSYGDGMLIL